ncbi:MAG: CRTAC1 family protein [Planctomycetes bacterium]|nr:CRTAC1 family protein [Planctomycetota bacterium]
MTTRRVPVALMLALAVLVGGCGKADDRERPPTRATAEAPRYVAVGREIGIDRVTYCGSKKKDHLLESTGSGAAFVDLDGDGHDDVFVLNGWALTDERDDGDARAIALKAPYAFYRNRGDGTFEERAEAAGLTGQGAWGCAVAAGDIDDDGDLDLYVACFGRNQLFRNLGQGVFEEIAESAGVADDGWGGGAAFFDADGDGDLDLYLSNYVVADVDDVLRAKRSLLYRGQAQVMVGPFGLEGGEDRFYRNRGDGTFEEVSDKVGLKDLGLGFGLGVLAADFDLDGDLDLYVANDSNPNYLYRNDGSGRFEDVAVVSGAAFSNDGAAQAGMGVETADFDGDGVLDIFVTHFAQDSSTLYRGEPGLFFSDVSSRSGVGWATFIPLSWGTLALDFDQDGDQDLLIANGHIYPQVVDLDGGQTYRQQNQLLRNDGGQFTDASAAAGADFLLAGSYRALAWGDLDGDLDPDLVLTRIDESPVVLRYDGGRTDRWLVVAAAPSPYPSWIGARIEVTVKGATQTRVILSGGSFASQSCLRAVFGLGDATEADRVVIRFPGGRSREYEKVPGGRVLRVPRPE